MDLTTCRQQFIKSDLESKSLIEAISTCDTSWGDYKRLHQDVSRCLCEEKYALEQMQLIANGLSQPSESLLADLEGFKAQLEANIASLRKATALSKKLIENRLKNELFSRSAVNSTRNRAQANKKALSEKSSALTDELVNIRQALTSQVQMSEVSLDTLVNSSATVTETQEEFKLMASQLRLSRKLLSKYDRREVTDKVLILLASAFFYACCFYVIMKRLP